MYEATPLEGANSHVQQTLIGAPKDWLLGSIDGSDIAATHGYPNAVTSTSYSATRPTANLDHDATSYASPSTSSIEETALQKTHIGALSNPGMTPQASNAIVCRTPEPGCTCFSCKHRILWDRDDTWNQPVYKDRDFLYGPDFAGDWVLWSFNGHFIYACFAPDCDRLYGVDRRRPTKHLFSPQLCSDKVQYCCTVQGCQFFSIRRSDLKRHHAAKHCTQPERFPCPEPLCKYGGDNGFIRSDKLKEHQKKIHEGKVRPGQALRTLKSAATKPVPELV